MLINDYTYFLLKIIGAGLLSAAGIASLVLLLSAILWVSVLGKTRAFRFSIFWTLALLACIAFGFAFTGAVYVYDERPETLVIESLPEGEPSCGVAQSGWIRSGYGMGNPCPRGCYRGKILGKEMRMRGFPPWPQYRRQMQCWTRE